MVRATLLSDASSQTFNGNFIFAGGLAPRLDANNQIVRNASGQPDLITINSLERYRRTLFFTRQGLSASAIREVGTPCPGLRFRISFKLQLFDASTHPRRLRTVNLF